MKSLTAIILIGISLCLINCAGTSLENLGSCVECFSDIRDMEKKTEEQQRSLDAIKHMVQPDG